MNDNLGERIKMYEKAFDSKLPIRLPMIIRLDGKAFHTMTRKWHCDKPFDFHMIVAMANTARQLCENIQGAVLAYTQSDEITIVVRDDQSRTSSPYLDKRIQKITSVTSSMAAAYFNYNMTISDDDKLAFFDSRAFVVPELEIVNVLIWRQQDCERNSIQMLAQSLYSHKELLNKKNPELQEMCFAKGQNWNDLSTMCKRGICMYKVPVEIQTENGSALRSKWKIDCEPPIFAKDKEYIESKTRKVEDGEGSQD